MKHIAALLVALLAFSGCGGQKPPKIPSMPTSVAEADKDVSRLAMTAFGILEAAGIVVKKITTIEVTNAALIPPAIHAQFKTNMGHLADRALKAIDDIEHNAVENYAQLKLRLDPILQDAQSLIDIINAQGPSFKDKLIDFATGLLEIVLSAYGPGAMRPGGTTLVAHAVTTF